MFFVGIDPGKSGAIAVLDSLESQGRELECTKLSHTERDVWAQLEALDAAESVALIERIVAMPISSKGNMTKLAISYGFMRGLLVASQIPFDELLPVQWQKKMSCLTRGDKNVSKARAQQLFPSYQVFHWNADAILLAECCRRTYNQRNGR